MSFRNVALSSGVKTCLTVLALLGFMAGCSKEPERPLTVLESLEQVEKAKKEFAEPPPASAAAAIPADAPAPADDPDLQQKGTFEVKFETSKGDFVVLVHRDWAPRGASRFYELVKAGFYDECRFFRVVSGFMVQFGISGDPAIQKQWENPIPDDPAKQSNKRGYMTFATSGPDSRTTQVFINFVDNGFLDSQGFSPFAEVIEGMDVVDSINAEYGETPDQGQINSRGNAYLKSAYPNLDFVKKVSIVGETN
jgi:peptidyl-prolyl cis-trans isomerase A (cyclophilin A)